MYPSFNETLSILREAVNSEDEINSKYVMYQVGCKYILKANAKRVNIQDINDVRDSNIFLFCISEEIRPTLVTPLVPKEEQNHVFVYLNISKIDEINEATKQLINQNNRIKGLILSSHGSPFKMNFGNTSNRNGILTCIEVQAEKNDQGKRKINVIRGGNCGEIKESINRLDKEAVISLISCYSGNVPKVSPFPSLAESIAQIAEGRLVVGCNNLIHTPGVYILVERETIQFKFEIPLTNERKGLTGKLMHLAYSTLFITNIAREDATAKFNTETYLTD